MDSLRGFNLCLRCLIVLGAMALTSLSLDGESAEKERDYFPAIRQELARLNMNALCDEASASCVITKSDQTTPPLEIVVKYSSRTETVYIYIDKYLKLESESGPSKALALKLLSLNSEMVTAKFEWNQTENAVRLSTTLNTDSNLDRRALRSQIMGLLEVAEKLLPNLQELARQ
jgi:hypothetical protein